MFRFCSLYSGSTGNSLYVETPNTKILIDAGESAKKIVSALSNIEVDITEINAILVTHEHSDHTAGLDDIRPFNFQQGKIPLFAHQRVIENLKNDFNIFFKTKIKILEDLVLLQKKVLIMFHFP